MRKLPIKTALALFFLAFTAMQAQSYVAKNLVIIIADEFRHDETFGEKTHKNIPKLWGELVPKGSYCTTFYGNPTFMVQVHLAILTGSWSDIRRLEPKAFPDNPTIFEVYRKALNKPQESCYYITSRREYWYLECSTNKNYGTNFKTVFEITSKEKDDDELVQKLTSRLKTQKPSLVVAHLGSLKSYNKKRREDEMSNYKEGMLKIDSKIYGIWSALQSLDGYKGNTNMILVSDHGDLITHADCDDECKRYVDIFAIGPDIKEGYFSEQKWRQPCIFHTGLKLLGIEPPDPKSVMQDFLK